MEARDEAAAVERLQASGFIPIRIEPVEAGAKSGGRIVLAPAHRPGPGGRADAGAGHPAAFRPAAGPGGGNSHQPGAIAADADAADTSAGRRARRGGAVQGTGSASGSVQPLLRRHGPRRRGGRRPGLGAGAHRRIHGALAGTQGNREIGADLSEHPGAGVGDFGDAVADFRGAAVFADVRAVGQGAAPGDADRHSRRRSPAPLLVGDPARAVRRLPLFCVADGAAGEQIRLGWPAAAPAPGGRPADQDRRSRASPARSARCSPTVFRCWRR